MKSEAKKQEVFIVLHNVRSVFNVGSVFRTADCLGVPNIILIGFTPTPIDRFGRSRKAFTKVSLGAEKTVSWKYFKTFQQALDFLQPKGFKLVAVEQAIGAEDYKKIRTSYPVAFIFGNEVSGIPGIILKQCDAVTEIPMRGKKESLNVSVAVGVSLSRILNI